MLGFGGLAFVTYMLLQGPVEFEDNLDLNSMTGIIIELDETAPSLDALEERIAPVEKYVAGLDKKTLAHWRTELGAAPKVGKSWKYATIRLIPPGDFVEKEKNQRHLHTAPASRTLSRRGARTDTRQRRGDGSALGL